MPDRPRPVARTRPRPGPGVQAPPEQIHRSPAAALRAALRPARAAFGPLAAHPRATQRGAIGGLFGGIAVFVALSATTATTVLTAAPTTTVPRRFVIPREVVATTPVVVPMPVRPALGAPAAQSGSRSGKGGGDASAGHGAISALAANGIPSVALNAYRVAAARMANVQPGCGIPWYLLAAIGREESNHGRYDGAVLHTDGISTPRIIGPALDGIHWDYVAAPPNGLALDGDAKYAHALGPMQFIPSTWAQYGADANGDGKADVFNINDAALGAARYLCAAGGDLTTQQGQTRAVLAYNHNSQYLAQVLALANAYHKGITITGLPVGITSGPLPALTNTGYIPPANPAAPMAAGKCSSKKAGASSGCRAGGSATPAHSSPAKHPSGTTSASGKPSPTGDPSPTGGTASPTPGSGSGTASGTASGSPSSSPQPSASKTCNDLQKLLGCKPS